MTCDQDGCQVVKAAVLLVALGPGCAVCCVMKKLQAFVWTTSSVSALLLKSQPQSVCAFKLLQEHRDKNNKATGASGPTRLHCGAPLVEDMFIL